jgi:DNA-binding NtrC family response regulator
VTTRARSTREERPPEAPRLLVVAPGADRDGLFRELAGHGAYEVRFAAGVDAAAEALAAAPVALLIAGPDVITADVSRLLAEADRLRPGLPVLVVRNRQAEEPAAWARRGVGVLRCPLLPEALSRSVGVVLGLAGR